MSTDHRVNIETAPHRLEAAHAYLFTKESLNFLHDFITEFDDELEKLHKKRLERNLQIKSGKWRPEFNNFSETTDWTIEELPERLKNRKLDLGDVSPANTTYFVDCLYTNVQGIQVDFDDGHCPTFRNTILGLYNVCLAVNSKLPGAPSNIQKCPLLMLRPRAFNMIEQNCMINGKQVSGTLFDFAILMFHCARLMCDLKIGPYFYLSKIEGPNETQFWNKIFIWTEKRLSLPKNSIKACVLIENILAAFCMDDILYSIREHAIGLNCGIWDYSASIVAKFSDRKEFLLPDRNKYVNMRQPFLENYMKLLINTCHKRNAIATGGMAAKVLPAGKDTKGIKETIVNEIKQQKIFEIEAGIDGFMIYDIRIVDDINQLWNEKCLKPNQIEILPSICHITPESLLKLPDGAVTNIGLKYNIKVALFFIYHWLSGTGVFFMRNSVEDSATAEISRSQIWQWIRHSASIEDENGKIIGIVTRRLVYRLIDDVIGKSYKTWCTSIADRKRLLSSKFILLEIISSRNFVEFITSYLYENHKFKTIHNKNDGLFSKLF
uniref:malate synthase n=1 Tax=Corethrella appendiculata TaxID=1370023 RepID=U5EYD5_9DIPT